MNAESLRLISDRGLDVFACAAAVNGEVTIGIREHDLVSPASVMKIQIALTVENMISTGAIDGSVPCVIPVEGRTPGPVGMSLMSDEITMSIRDLVVAMLTISDNVATDELIAVAGLDRVNRFTQQLGLNRTLIASDLRQMLEDIACEVGFADYLSFAAHDPKVDGPPSNDEVAHRIGTCASLDPTRGSRTTAYEMVQMLRAVWTDRAGDPAACQRVRHHMAHQLTRTRIASGFDPTVAVAAKSGALLKVVRNEAGVVTYPDDSAFAVAVFTRRDHDNVSAASEIDRVIGRVARSLVDELRGA